MFIAKVGYKLEKEKFRQHSPEIINSNYLLQGQYFEFQICSNLFSSHQGTKIKVKTSTASGLQAVWPEENRQMSIKAAQKWFHYKNERFWHLYKFA